MFEIAAGYLGEEPIFEKLTDLELFSLYRILVSSVETIRVEQANGRLKLGVSALVESDAFALGIRASLTLAKRITVRGSHEMFLMKMPDREEWFSQPVPPPS